jgi:hypothetical protein
MFWEHINMYLQHIDRYAVHVAMPRVSHFMSSEHLGMLVDLYYDGRHGFPLNLKNGMSMETFTMAGEQFTKYPG